MKQEKGLEGDHRILETLGQHETPKQTKISTLGETPESKPLDDT